MAKRKTNDEFIIAAKKVHSKKYDYSKTQYINNYTKVCIICPEHGEFWQRPSCHLNGQGCARCNGGIKYDIETFLKKSNETHNFKYDYSKVNYVSSNSVVCIICPEHGEFWQIAHNHLNGCGCPKCANLLKIKKQLSTTDEFINKTRLIHYDKYDYSKVEYINSHTKVCIICHEHGEFWQLPYLHLSGCGCPKCGYDNVRNSLCDSVNTFINKAKQIYENKYDYSKVKYKNNRTKVCIICSKHGEFWQLPNNHLNGHGCEKCSSSHMEDEMRRFLKNHNINFEEQKKFKWLEKQRFDFFLKDYNIAIECQGIQHFVPSDFFGKDGFDKIKIRDEKKKLLSKENKIEILYYANYKFDFPYDVYTSKEKMLNAILNTKKNV